MFSSDDTKALSQHRNHSRTNNQLIYLLYSDVKNLTSILSFCIGPKCVFSNDDTKAVFLCELHFSLFLKLTFKSSAHKQPINFRYNDVKNFTSILSFCIGPKCVFSRDDTKALFLCDLQFSLIFTSRPLNQQRTNKQLITLLYNKMKSLSSILS